MDVWAVKAVCLPPAPDQNWALLGVRPQASLNSQPLCSNTRNLGTAVTKAVAWPQISLPRTQMRFFKIHISPFFMFYISPRSSRALNKQHFIFNRNVFKLTDLL
jgi:hypothetical protein